MGSQDIETIELLDEYRRDEEGMQRYTKRRLTQRFARISFLQYRYQISVRNNYKSRRDWAIKPLNYELLVFCLALMFRIRGVPLP